MIGDKEFPLDEVLLKTVNRVFKEILGETGTFFVHCQLRHRHELERGAIPRKIEPSAKCLIELLGSGSEAILKMIVNGVTEKLGVRAPRDPVVEVRGLAQDNLRILHRDRVLAELTSVLVSMGRIMLKTHPYPNE